MVNFIVRLLKWLWPLGLVLLAVGFGMAIKEKQFTETAAILSVAGLLLFLLIFLRGESANVKFYINVTLASVVTLAIMVVLYLFAADRKVNWDLSKNKSNSLADQSISIVRNLKSPIKLVGFYNKMMQPINDQQVQDFFDRYSAQSKQVQVEMVDPVRNNARVKQYNQIFGTDVRPGDIFVVNEATPKKTPAASAPTTAKPRFKRITLPRTEGDPMDALESPVTNGIIEVTQDKQVKVYVLQGPGYMSLEYQAMDKEHSISTLKTQLTDQAMDVQPLELRGPVPSDCTVLMAAGIQNDLFPTEVDNLSKYLDKGGKMIVYFDPPERQDLKLDNWAKLLSRYGVQPTNNLIIDAMGQQLGDATVFVASSFDPTHPITKDIRQRMAFQGVRAISKVEPAPQGYTTTELVKSSSQSWTMPFEQLMQSNRLVMPAKDQIKPQPLAIAISKAGEDNGTKLVIFGNAGMISDAGLNPGALTLTTLSLNWLAGNEDRLAIPPRQLDNTPLFVSDAQMAVIFIVVVLFLPAALFFGGLSYTMLRRRSR